MWGFMSCKSVRRNKRDLRHHFWMNNKSAPNGALLGQFDIDMQAELQEMLKQELRQMKENRQMDELKHKGKLHSDAGAIAQ